MCDLRTGPNPHILKALYRADSMEHDYNEYFARLAERTTGGLRIQFRQVQHDGWEPKLNDCHENVDYWTARRSDCKAVRGWLFWPPDASGRWRFMAHSVVEERGELVDITPIDSYTRRDDLLFLTHLGSDEEFEAMKIPFSEYLYPPMTMDEWRAGQLVVESEEDAEANF